VMRYNLPTRQAEFAEIGRLLQLGSAGDGEQDLARAAILRMEEILGVLGVPLNLRELGLEPEQFEYVAEQAMLASRLTANNPRELTRESVVEILRKGYADDRSWWEL